MGTTLVKKELLWRRWDIMIEIVPFVKEFEGTWDEFCIKENLNFQFQRKFLNYHPHGKFIDASCILKVKNEISGVFPAALVVGTAVSHPGLAHGGLGLRREKGILGYEAAINAIIEYYSSNGFKGLTLKHKPIFYRGGEDAIEEYYLKKNKFEISSHELNSIINLSAKIELSSRKKRNLKKFSGISQEESIAALYELYELLKIVLMEQHSIEPVHSYEDLLYLMQQFPNELSLFTSRIDGILVAGAIVFKYPEMWHTQYLANGDLGRKNGALDAVIISLIESARNSGAKYLSLGTSTESNGEILNEGLLTFKREFGALAVSRHHLTREI